MTKEVDLTDCRITVDELTKAHLFLEQLKTLEQDLGLRLIHLEFSVEEYPHSKWGPKFTLRRRANQARVYAPLRLTRLRGRIG